MYLFLLYITCHKKRSLFSWTTLFKLSILERSYQIHEFFI
nr:MAG TPA: hypothetical protein [Caudoviricetes sp.]DAU27898.1 MAG TPA: hypothetical protein [Caudoviricetes sp.]DAY97300.1 MAG TPA: hypothetical protein [Caudoviricetes sp.]